MAWKTMDIIWWYLLGILKARLLRLVTCLMTYPERTLEMPMAIGDVTWDEGEDRLVNALFRSNAVSGYASHNSSSHSQAARDIDAH